jgi:predicted nucleic acid-binding protein
MAQSVLVDTNVLVYVYDSSEPSKQKRALSTLDRLVELGTGHLTPQTLAEFFVVVTCKIPQPLTSAEAYQRIENYLLSWVVLPYSGQVVLEAARGVRDYALSYWDAQIWAAAHLSQIPVIFSEDFNPGHALEGVRFVNPFEPDFDPAHWE